MQNLIEQLKAHSLTKYVRFDKENEQVKLYLKQPDKIVIWESSFLCDLSIIYFLKVIIKKKHTYKADVYSLINSGRGFREFIP